MDTGIGLAEGADDLRQDGLGKTLHGGDGYGSAPQAFQGVEFGNRGRRQEEQVDLMRRLWSQDVFSYHGTYHSFEHASILPRPTEPIPVLFGGSAPALIERCARLGDGWIPLGGPNEKSAQRLAEMRTIRAAAGLPWDGFTVHAQAQWGGGTPERWQAHAQKWKDLGATHLSVATHNAGPTDVDGHLARIAEYQAAIADVAG